MPLSGFDPVIRRNQSLEDYQTPFSDYVTSKFMQAFDSNPTTMLVDRARMVDTFTEDPDQVPFKPRIDAESARQIAKDSRVTLQIPDDGISQDALDLLIKRKTDERTRADAINRSPTGMRSIVGTGASLAAGALDPLFLGASMIPVVAPTRYALALDAAGSAISRAGIRAAAGSVQGAAGMAFIEPVNYSLHHSLQDDYTALDSIMNIGFGGVLGGGLHVLGGAAKDMILGYKPDELSRLIRTYKEEQAKPAPTPETAETVTPETIDAAVAKNEAEIAATPSPIQTPQRPAGYWEGRSTTDFEATDTVPSVAERAKELFTNDRTWVPNTAPETLPSVFRSNRKTQGVETLSELQRSQENVNAKIAAEHLTTKSFMELSRMSDEVQGRIDALHDKLENQGVSWEDQKKHPELTTLYDERIAYDEAAARKGYSGAKQVVETVLSGMPHDTTFASVDSILRERYSLTENPAGVYMMSQYTGKAIDNPRTLRDLANDIAKLVVARDYPNADYHALMGSNMSALTEVGRSAILREAADKAQQINDGLRTFFIGAVETPTSVPARLTVQAATPTQREAALNAAVGQALEGKVAEVRPIFDPSVDVKAAAEQAHSPDNVRVADKPASAKADEVVQTAPKGIALVDAERSLSEAEKAMIERWAATGRLPEDLNKALEHTEALAKQADELSAAARAAVSKGCI